MHVFQIRVPDLPATHPDRHLKGCMYGRFKNMIEVRAVVRDTELRFAKPGGKFGDSSGYDGRAAGATFLLSAKDFGEVIQSLGDMQYAQFPTSIEFPIPNDLPVRCQMTYSNDTIHLPDGREVYIGWKCGRVLCDCENDTSCPFFVPPTHVGHLEYWKNKKIKIEKKIEKKTKNQQNKAKLLQAIEQANF